jgi:hypothetical protein
VRNDRSLTNPSSAKSLTPALSHREREQECLVCAVDLGGTNLRAATIDRVGQVHDRARSPTPRTNDASEIVSAIASVVIDCVDQAALHNSRVERSLWFRSVHADTGLVANAPNVRPSSTRFVTALADTLSDRPYRERCERRRRRRCGLARPLAVKRSSVCTLEPALAVF